MSKLLKENVGLTDRYVRIALGSLLVAAAGSRLSRNPDAGAFIVGLLGGMTLAEGILGTCPLYSLTGISTRAQEHTEYTNSVIQPYEGI